MNSTDSGRFRVTVNTFLRTLPVLVAVGLMYSGILWNWDQIVYDWGQRLNGRDPLAEIVIVEIDQQSIDAIGRWPWSRNVHAELVERLHDAGARVIGLDIIFSEESTVDADSQLIDAVRDSGRVVLPVLNGQHRQGGQLREILPIPDLTENAAKLGHVDRPIDADSVSRSSYLKAGLGDAHWPSFALAMLQQAYPGRMKELPGIRVAHSPVISPFVWQRDHHVWLSFAGPPGHFPRVSYRDVLNSDFPTSLFRGKLIIVGATAAGLGDSLPTPVSGNRQPMPGVEIIATELDTLINGLGIVPLSAIQSMLITLALVLISMQMLSRFSPSWSLWVTVGCVIASLTIAGAGLILLRHWFAPMASIAGVVFGYGLWSWRRLVHTVQHLNRSLQQLEDEPRVAEFKDAPELDSAMFFLSEILPVDAGKLLDEKGETKAVWRKGRENESDNGDSRWYTFNAGDRNFSVCWRGELAPDSTEISLLSSLAEQFSPPAQVRSHTPVEMLEQRIQQVEAATDDLQKMRQFVTEILAQMDDGIIVADNLGRILLANTQAAIIFDESDEQTIESQPLQRYWKKLNFNKSSNSIESLRAAVVDRTSCEVEARGPEGVDLLVNVVPFRFGPTATGIIINLVDTKALKDSERQRRDVLSFLSHDLRSPLASIITVTQLVKMSPDRLADLSDIERINDNAQRTLQMADDFLDLLRVEEVKSEEFVRVDLVATAKRSLAILSDVAASKNISLEFDQSKSMSHSVYVKGDQGLLERMFTNLLSNAIKYSPDSARVVLGVEDGSREIVCWVMDTGYGVELENIPKLFERFGRILREEHQQETGSGLGLLIVKNVVELHRGSIEVESKLNQGTKFTVKFPRYLSP